MKKVITMICFLGFSLSIWADLAPRPESLSYKTIKLSPAISYFLFKNLNFKRTETRKMKGFDRNIHEVEVKIAEERPRYGFTEKIECYKHYMVTFKDTKCTIKVIQPKRDRKVGKIIKSQSLR